MLPFRFLWALAAMLLVSPLFAQGAPPVPAPATPAIIGRARAAQGDYTTLWRMLDDQETPRPVRDALLQYLRSQARREPPLDSLRAVLWRLPPAQGGSSEQASPGARVPAPKSEAWALLAAGERALTQHRLQQDQAATRPTAAASSKDQWLVRAQEVQAHLSRLAGPLPPEYAAFAATLATWDSEASALRYVQLIQAGLEDTRASSGLLAYLTDWLSDDLSYFGAEGPGRVTFVAGYRRALKLDRGWSPLDQRRARVELAGHLLLDQIAGRRGTRAEWDEAQNLLRSVLHEDPEHEAARAHLIYSHGLEGDIPAAREVLEEAPNPKPFESISQRLDRMRSLASARLGVRNVEDSIELRMPARLGDGPRAWFTGDFDRWIGGRYGATRTAEEWVARLPLAPGEYRYALEIDGQRRDDLTGAPNWCRGEPCFQVLSTGRVAASDEIERAYAVVRHMSGQLEFSLGKAAALRALKARPQDTRSLEAFRLAYIRADLPGHILEDYAALTPAQGFRKSGAEFLRGLAARERFPPSAAETGGPLAGLHGTYFLEQAVSTAQAPDQKVHAFARFQAAPDSTLLWAGDFFPFSQTPEGRAALLNQDQGDAAYLTARARVLAHQRDSTAEARAENVKAAEDALKANEAEDGARAQVRRARASARLGEDPSAQQAVLLRALAAFPHSLNLLTHADWHFDVWPEPAKILAAITIPPTWSETSPLRLRLKARLLKTLGRFDEALTALDKADKLAPDDPALAHHRGCVFLDQGNAAAGITALHRSRTAGDRSPHVLERLTQALIVNGRQAELLELVEKQGVLAELRPGPMRGHVLVQSVVARQRRGDPSAPLLPLLREGLGLLDDASDPQGVIRLSGHMMLIGFGAELGDVGAIREGTAYFGDHEYFQVGLAACLLVFLLAMGLSLATVVFFSRRRPVLRSFLATPLVWTFCVAVQMLAAAVFGWAVFGNASLGLFAPQTEGGALALMVGYGVMAFPIAGYALFEFWMQGLGAADLGLDLGPRLADLWAGFQTWVAMIATNILLLAALAAVVHFFSSQVSTAVAGGDTLPAGTNAASQQAGGALGIYFQTILLAPLMEELFFRGYVYGTWRKKLGPWPAALLSALFFGAIHFQSILPIFVAGVFFARAYEKHGSLWVPVLAHVCMNGVAIALRAHGIGP